MHYGIAAVAAFTAPIVAMASPPIKQCAYIPGEWVLETPAITLTGARNQQSVLGICLGSLRASLFVFGFSDRIYQRVTPASLPT